MTERGCGDELFGCVAKLLLSPWTWVVGVFFVVFVCIPISINLDTPAVDTVAEIAPTPTPYTTEPSGGWDESDWGINRNATCVDFVVGPLIFALAFAFKR